MKQQINYGHENGYCGRRNRTSRFVMFLRACVCTWFIAMFLGWLTNGFFHWIPPEGKGGAEYSGGSVSFDDQVKIFLMYNFIAVPVATALATSLTWFFTNIAAHAFYGHNPVWRQWIREGGDPFWDNLWWPINQDSDIVKRGGVDPLLPVPPGVHVDSDWDYQCQNCFNMLPYEGAPCQVCGQGFPPSPTATPMGKNPY